MTAGKERLIDETITRIRTVIHRFASPAVMSSFGKDSMVLLHCIREAGFNLPVIYLRDPWQPHKHSHANEVIRQMGLTVHDWPPTGMGVKYNGERLEFVARYQFGPDSFIDIPKNIEPQLPKQRLLCGVHDIIRRPIGTFRHGWDVILIGHKSSDVDQFYGSVPLHLDLKQAKFGVPSLYFPLRTWTDEDVWNVIEDAHLPYQKDRYADRVELDDKSASNDYVQCCSKCLDPRNGKTVHCPRYNAEISSAYEFVPHFEPKPDYFGEGVLP